MTERVLLHGAGTEARHASAFFRGREGFDLALFDDGGSGLAGVPSLGQAEAEAFVEGAIYLRSPGIPPSNPLVDLAARRASFAATPTGYWLRNFSPPGTVTVTGTKGKSTTTALLALLLEHAGLMSSAYGNIGEPPLRARLPHEHHPVLECSSYMMHDLPEADHVHLVTNLYRDHLDWHGGVEAYHAAKLRPFTRSTPRRGAAPLSVIKRYGLPASIAAVETLVPDGDDGLRLGGRRLDTGPRELGFFEGPLRHNLRTACAGALFFADEDNVRCAAEAALRAFRGLPSRQYIIPTRDGRLWVDDALATIPEATLAALRRFEERRTVLILGGGDRGQDFEALEAYARGREDLTVLAFDDAGSRFAGADERPAGFEAAVRRAAEICPHGGVILFSPSAPSMPPFADFKARSALFTKLAGQAT